MPLAKLHTEWFQLLEVNFPVIASLWWRVLEITKIRCATNWPVWFWSCSLGYNTVRGGCGKARFDSQTNTYQDRCEKRKLFQTEPQKCAIFFLLIGWEKVLGRFIPFTRTWGSVSTNIPGHLLRPVVSWASRKYKRRIHHSLILRRLAWRGENVKSRSQIVRFQIGSKNNLDVQWKRS